MDQFTAPMASHFHAVTSSRAAVPPLHSPKFIYLCSVFSDGSPYFSRWLTRKYSGGMRISMVRATNGGGDQSYLDMWKKAVARERKTVEFERMAKNSSVKGETQGEGESDEDMKRKSSDFQKLLEVPAEERDRVQRMQVIDRAAAAIAAARALIKDRPRQGDVSGESDAGGYDMEDPQEGKQSGSQSQTGTSGIGTPGPSFWEWTPPVPTDDADIVDKTNNGPAIQASPSPAQSIPVLEKERSPNFLLLPFETSTVENRTNLPLPPLQSLIEAKELDATKSTTEVPHLEREQELGVEFTTKAAEAVDALSKVEEALSEGVNPDGSRWWKETGIEQRPDGVICKWTLTRGVSADKATEWETKYWEAADDFGYKELGSEKSGRDAMGNVWREFWRESMMEVNGRTHLEKTADKWGKNIQGDEWQEQWWEHYDDSGRAEKWVHKWCSIDPHTPVDVGHAHVWHERWGEKYDGQGGSDKYTDKWAERFEGDGWAKWGDKWDEHFNAYSQGVKQGETWWQGKSGERWNRTWGEGHNGSGWVHKYGKSSSGEHWDTHVQQDTWYERFPHFGFYHCLDNSVQLRNVKKPSDLQ